MSEIQLREPLGNFAYFFIGTCILAVLGAKVPYFAQDIGDIMQDHIAGKTICVTTMLALFGGYLCAAKNIFRPSKYGTLVRLLIVNPSQFTVTLAFVAAAINWGVALSTYVLFPLVVRGQVFEALVRNAMQISGIALLLAIGLWLFHLAPDKSKTNNPCESLATLLFWVAIVISSLFWIGFFGRIAWLATRNA